MSLSAHQARREHVLAVSRDFNSQPRLSKYQFFEIICVKKNFFFHSHAKMLFLTICVAVSFSAFLNSLRFVHSNQYYIPNN